MLFNVSQLLRERVGSRREYRISEPSVVLERGAEPVGVEGTALLTRTQSGVLVQARVLTTARDACSRCLRDVEYPVRLDIEEEYVPTIDPVTGVRLPEPEDPEAFRIDQRHHLDLSEAVREYLVAAEAMQPLCRPDCAGLCPVCGADRNVDRCGCEVQTPDPRWAALARLRVPEGS
ncbi:MAG TPA: DUF177 domain-containing protein [Dehalococcoidia bacterium]